MQILTHFYWRDLKVKSSWKIIIFTTFVFHSCIFTVIFNFLIKVIMHTGLVMMGHPVYHHDCLHYSWVSTTIVGHIVSSFKDPCIHNFQPREPWIPTNFRFWQFCLCDADFMIIDHQNEDFLVFTMQLTEIT